MKKQCKRKVWKLVNPIDHAREGACLIDKTSSDKLAIMELSALDRFTKGAADKEDWRQLCMMTNIAEELASMGYGKSEILEPCAKGQAALKEAHRRFNEFGRLTFSGLEIQHMREICEWVSFQRQCVPRGTYEKAIDKVMRLVRGKSPRVEVLL
ncbi:hypothetical protein UFOVP607_38 [uncultured Caudovirales phage]|uniref:Uncharacterized protein n=1 Tax=uncultured Caudovirales phage TaxID=2100421 RepID=A0A6J5N2D1_9CAUD|nr:hypothetical protein UFOVP607_38 [uncultured Caudovirales phage]